MVWLDRGGQRKIQIRMLENSCRWEHILDKTILLFYIAQSKLTRYARVQYIYIEFILRIVIHEILKYFMGLKFK